MGRDRLAVNAARRLVSSATAAREVGVHVGSLSRWVKDGLVTPNAVTAGGHYRWDIDDLRAQIEQLRRRPTRPREEPHVPAPATRPEHQPVVAAIVTSAVGVLAGRRRDNSPPWTFIAGEIEPGEAMADAAVREVKEEAGLLVRAGHQEIGRRVHPKTGRTMIYLACLPVEGTDVFVGDEDELAEVRWLSLAEVDTLLPGVYEPVREHLNRLIT